MSSSNVENPNTVLRNSSGTEIATSGNPLRVDPTGTTTQPVSIAGTVTVTGGLTDAQLRASAVPVSLTSTTITGTVAISAASLPLPSGAATETTLAAASAKLPATLGQKTSANSLAVVVASDQSVLPVQDDRPASASDTPVTVGTTAVVAVSANTARKGLILCNCDGGRTIWLRFGATDPTSVRFSVQLAPGSTYELPSPAYTGAIRAIASGAGGILLVQELT